MDSGVQTAGVLEPLLSQGPRIERHASGIQQAISNLDGQKGEPPSARQLGFYDGVAMVLCTQIGSGIFISPSLVALNSGSKPVALGTWLLSGLLTWACALCYVELGVRMPLNGGPQEYLAHCFNDFAAFLASWGTIFALKPCTAALLAVFVSDYLCDAVGISDPLPVFYRKLIPLATLAVLTFINCAGNTQSRIATKLLVGCKICGLVFVLFLSLVPLASPGGSPSVPADNTRILPPSLRNYPDGILQALYAFSGWETVRTIVVYQSES
jgi:solute carrier family 7 (L-type amino acid transporter), member 6